MDSNWTFIGVVVLGLACFATVGSGACGKRKAECETVCKRLRECATAVGRREAESIAQEQGEWADALEAARQARAKVVSDWYRDVRECLDRCLRRLPGHDYDRAKKCLRRRSCEDFAHCFLKEMR